MVCVMFPTEPMKCLKMSTKSIVEYLSVLCYNNKTHF